jgi:hypothetical protein
MPNFFRFPAIPHLAWMAQNGMPREDKVLSLCEARALLASDVTVEEKLDGANLGLSVSIDGALRAQNRGQFLSEPYAGQFARLPAWLALHEDDLRTVLSPDLVLFGEWCAARHSLEYTMLPDWFLLFDVYECSQGFWSTSRRNALAAKAALCTVPLIRSGRATLPALEQLVMGTPSRYRTGLPLEGLVVRRELGDWCEARAKLVRPDFAQAIDTHWRKRPIQWNQMDWTQP